MSGGLQTINLARACSPSLADAEVRRDVAKSMAARIALPTARVADRAATRRRVKSDVDQRQIDIEEWIAAARAHEERASQRA